MPSLTSFLFPKYRNNQCCHCSCHPPTADHHSSTAVRHTGWLSIIRRNSSSSSNTSQSQTSNSTVHTLESITTLEHEEDFSRLYDLAVDEIRYATEFQGSIYYGADLFDAQIAVNQCFDRFQCLIHTLPLNKSTQFQQKWSKLLIGLRAKLDALPSED